MVTYLLLVWSDRRVIGFSSPEFLFKVKLLMPNLQLSFRASLNY